MKTIENYTDVQFLSLAIIVEFAHFYTNPTTTTILQHIESITISARFNICLTNVCSFIRSDTGPNDIELEWWQ